MVLYKSALELDPDDEDAKFNLEFVRDEIARGRARVVHTPRDLGCFRVAPDACDRADTAGGQGLRWRINSLGG